MGLVTYVSSTMRVGSQFPHSDFAAVWKGAAFLLAGQDPYAMIGHGAAWEYQSSLPYPLPALLVAAPFAPLTEHVANAVFFGIGAAVLAFVLLVKRPHAWPALLSCPMLLALIGVQWAPLLAAGVLVPWLGGLLVVKPNVGLALAAYALHDRRWLTRAAIGGAALVLVSFLVMPEWPASLAAAMQRPAAPHFQAAGASAGIYQSLAMLLPAGPLVLLAALRWRRPEARLLVALALVPHSMLGYELLAVMVLVPRAWREAATLAALSWGLLVFRNPPSRESVAVMQHMGWLSTWCVMLPATLLVLRRPNEGPAVAWPWRVRSPSTPRPSAPAPEESRAPARTTASR